MNTPKILALGEAHVTMTAVRDRGEFKLGGTGTVTINWGDRSKSETFNLIPFDKDDKNKKKYRVKHRYSEKSEYTITITGKVQASITYLSCCNMALTALDVSQNPALIELWCQYNDLSELDVSRNTALIALHCGGNNLAALDVSQNTALLLLSCYNNELTALDVSRNAALEQLIFDIREVHSSTCLL